MLHGVALWRFARTNRHRRDELSIANKRKSTTTNGSPSPWKARVGILGVGSCHRQLQAFCPHLAMFGLTSDEEIGATHAAWQRVFIRRIYRSFWQRCALTKKSVGAIGVRVPRSSSIRRLDWVLDRGRWLGDTGRQLMVGICSTSLLARKWSSGCCAWRSRPLDRLVEPAGF